MAALRWVLRAAAAALALATAVRWLDQPWTVLAAAQAAAPLVAISTVLLFAAALVSRTWRLAGATAVLLAVHAVLWWPAPQPPTAVEGSGDLVVMAANVEYGQSDPQALVRAVREQDVDVLVLVEATVAGWDGLSAAGLADVLPERAGRTREDAGGTVVVSRLPLIELPLDDRPTGSSTTFDQPVVRVQTDGGPVLLRAAHPFPPLDASVWRRELRGLDRWARAQPTLGEGGTPLVLAGDLNASADHPGLRAITSGREGLVDAHRADGAAWVRTWPSDRSFPALVQLDHVLVRDLGVVDTGVLSLPGSDHRAVWARLSVP